MNRDRFKWRGAIDLQGRLWLVMLFVLLPALAYIATRSVLERNRARAQAQADLLKLARLTAAGQQRSLDEMQGTLALAAVLSQVQVAAQGGDPAACSSRLAEVAALYPQTSGFGIWKLSGDLLCADHPPPAPASAANQLWFRQVLAQRTFSLGDFQVEDPNGQSTITCAYPVTGANGQLLGVISSGLDLGHLTQTAGSIFLPAGALITVFDHNGNVLASSASAAAWVGKSLTDAPSVMADLARGANVQEHGGNDGVTRIYAYAPVPGPGGDLVYLSVGRPVLAVYGPADTALAVSLAVVSLLTVLALLLAGWWSRQTLVRPIWALLTTTDRLSKGDLTARANVEPAGSEVDRLAESFNALAASLERREAERGAAREAAEQAIQQAQQGRTRAAQLEAVSAGLSMALTPAEVMDVVLRQGAGACGASAATLLLVSPDGLWLRQAATVGFSDRISRLLRQFPVSSPLPPSDAVRTGQAVWIESAAAYRARYPQLTDIIDSTDYEAAVVLPLRYAGRVIGALALGFPGMLTFTGEIQTYLLTLAILCAEALERGRLYEETQRLNSAAEAQMRTELGDR